MQTECTQEFVRHPEQSARTTGSNQLPPAFVSLICSLAAYRSETELVIPVCLPAGFISGSKRNLPKARNHCSAHVLPLTKLYPG